MSQTERRLPLARKHDLIVKELQNESVIYDSKRDKAFCLNHTSALIWKACDGKTPVSAMTQALQAGDSSINDSVVWFALQQLEADGLLAQPICAPAEAVGLTRKDIIRKFGVAAALVPFVALLIAPTPAKAFSGSF